MNSLVFNNLVRFVLLVFLQVFLLSKMHFFGTYNPNIYLLFILMLPFSMNPWIGLLIAFFTGFAIDVFNGTIGLHISATLFTAYLRPYVIKLVGEKIDYAPTSQPSVKEMGLNWFLSYAGILTLVHSLTLNYLDMFSFNEFFRTFFRAVAGGALTLIIMFSLLYIFPERDSKK